MITFRCGIVLAVVGVCAAVLPARGQNPADASAAEKEKPAPSTAAPAVPASAESPAGAPAPPGAAPASTARAAEAAPGEPASAAALPAAATTNREKHSGPNFWSPERELALGQQLDKALLANAELLDDPVVSRYLAEVARRVAGNSEIRLPIQLRVLATSEPTSFSLPGGFVYITAGMVQETESEAELAAVLAHEVAHESARHATRQITQREILGWATIALLFVGGPVGLGLDEAAMFGMPLTEQKLSRRDETQADALGLRYLVASGYDPTAAVSLLERLASHDHPRAARLQRIFGSQPLLRDRLQAVTREMQKLPEREDYVVSTSKYEEMVGRLRRLGFAPDSRGPVLLRKTKDSDVDP